MKLYCGGDIRTIHAEKMNNFVLMFGVPKDTDDNPGTMPKGVSLTEQGTFKAIIKRQYLGTFKDIEHAINAVTEHLNNN